MVQGLANVLGPKDLLRWRIFIELENSKQSGENAMLTPEEFAKTIAPVS